MNEHKKEILKKIKERAGEVSRGKIGHLSKMLADIILSIDTDIAVPEIHAIVTIIHDFSHILVDEFLAANLSNPESFENALKKSIKELEKKMASRFSNVQEHQASLKLLEKLISSAVN